MSAHLTKKFPDAKILQVDKMQEFGGLAVSSKIDDSDTYLWKITLGITIN